MPQVQVVSIERVQASRRIQEHLCPEVGMSLLQRIEADAPKLSPKFAQLAACLVRQRGIPLRQCITDLATASGTTPVTVVRLAQRYGLTGFRQLKVAFLEEAADLRHEIVRGRSGAVRSEASPACRALDDAVSTINDLRALAVHPGFEKVASWLRDADVWIHASMPGDKLLAECMLSALAGQGLVARLGRMTPMAVDACRLGNKSIQLHVALASPLQGPEDFVSLDDGESIRRVFLTRALRHGVWSTSQGMTIGLHLLPATQPLPLLVPLLAALHAAVTKNDDNS
jgi:hypothetical protein